MIKQLIIRSLLVLSPVAAFSQETRIPLTDKVSVSFPEKPSRKEMGPVAMHTVSMTDSTADFIATVTNLNKSNGLTAEMLETAQSAPEFMDQVQVGFIGQLGPDVKVLSKEVKNIGGRQVLNLLVESDRNGKKYELSVYLFIHDVYSVNIVHRKRTDGASVDAKNAFFESLRIAE